jgi:thiamine-phosphate pyrophosphorylase
MAEAILPVTRRANVGLVINDHLDIARETGAELCHLGQEDFFDAGYKHTSELRTPNSELRIGLSTHSPEQAKRALAAGPDYIAIGPVYATGTKPMAKPVTLEYVRWAAAPQSGVNIPWFAIGGINLRTLDDVLAAGAKRVCVVSAILNATDVMKACLEFRRRLV